jgi:hypothetical protein
MMTLHDHDSARQATRLESALDQPERQRRNAQMDRLVRAELEKQQRAANHKPKPPLAAHSKGNGPMDDKIYAEVKELRSTTSKLVDMIGEMRGLTPTQIEAMRRQYGTKSATNRSAPEAQTSERESARLALAARMGLSTTDLTAVHSSDHRLVLGADARSSSRGTAHQQSPEAFATMQKRMGVPTQYVPQIISTECKLTLGAIVPKLSAPRKSA